MSSLLALPAEILHLVLSFLPPVSLGSIAQTCRLLNVHAQDDKLWQALLQQSLPATVLTTPAPTSSFRELYMAHLPYWFLPKYKIWFADTQATGKLLIARYSPSRQTIEAYALAADRGTSAFKFWKWNPEVIIHTFDPKVQLDLNQPVLRLRPEDNHAGRPTIAGEVLQQEMQMETHNTHANGHISGVSSAFMLARPLNPEAIFENTQVWPPLTLPATIRSRNASQDVFRSSGHRPTKLSEVSTQTFRIRKWIDFTHRLAGVSMRVAEDVATYATLPPEAYTPTKVKPWRGIWCGDYSGHGCEFLAVLQPDEDEDLPEGVGQAMHGRRSRSGSAESWQTAVTSIHSEGLSEGEETPPATTSSPPPDSITPSRHMQQPASDDEQAVDDDDDDDDDDLKIYKGQLLAVKLTGDPNVPRGQYTFRAPDISPNGTIRIADEEMFKGARIVHSVGHIAGRGYREGMRHSTLLSPSFIGLSFF
jgi:hypothetical protein